MNYMNGDIITLANNENYVIVDIIDRFYDRYYYVVSVTPDKMAIASVCKIVKIVESNEGNYLKVIDEKDELTKVVSLFLSRYV